MSRKFGVLSTVAGAALALALAVLALAGPSWRRMEVPLWQTRTPLVVAANLSGAMQANDLQPSRLLQMRAKIATLLRERAGGQVGLVAYADDAYTVAPLTDDASNVALFIDALSPDVMPVDGDRADRAQRQLQGEGRRVRARVGHNADRPNVVHVAAGVLREILDRLAG